MQRLGLVTDGSHYDLNASDERDIYLNRIAFVAINLQGPVWIREKTLSIKSYTGLIIDGIKKISACRPVTSMGEEQLFINFPKLLNEPDELKKIVNYGHHFGVRVGCHLDGESLKHPEYLSVLSGHKGHFSFPVHQMDELEQVILLKKEHCQQGQEWHVMISPLFYTACKPVASPYAEKMTLLNDMVEKAKENGFVPWFLGGVNLENLQSMHLDFARDTGGFLTHSLGMMKDAETIEPLLLKMNQVIKRL